MLDRNCFTYYVAKKNISQSGDDAQPAAVLDMCGSNAKEKRIISGRRRYATGTRSLFRTGFPFTSAPNEDPLTEPGSFGCEEFAAEAGARAAGSVLAKSLVAADRSSPRHDSHLQDGDLLPQGRRQLHDHPTVLQTAGLRYARDRESVPPRTIVEQR